jgi:hypothetical protein
MQNSKVVNIQIASDSNNFEVFSPVRVRLRRTMAGGGLRRGVPNCKGLSVKRRALIINSLHFNQNALSYAPGAMLYFPLEAAGVRTYWKSGHL